MFLEDSEEKAVIKIVPVQPVMIKPYLLWWKKNFHHFAFIIKTQSQEQQRIKSNSFNNAENTPPSPAFTGSRTLPCLLLLLDL